MKKILLSFVFSAVLFLAGIAAASGSKGDAVTVKAGNIITFGTYEQDNDPGNGKEPIKWLVLAAEDDHVLAISQKVLDVKPYHSERIDVIWETGGLRSWLNEEFFSDAFSTSEQSHINAAALANPSNPVYGTDGGPDTEDRVFLLSAAEVNEYFSGDDARKCVPTEFAKAQGGYIDAEYGTSWWWLRTSGDKPSNAAFVYGNGSSLMMGTPVVNNSVGVRPAIRIDYSAAKPISPVDVGEIITFGSYEQDNELHNGKEPIKWQVLAADPDHALVISLYGLDAMPFHTTQYNVTWKNSSIRNWLNGEFYSGAFNASEKQQILKVLHVDTDGPENETKKENDTADWIFLLSVDEINKFIADYSDRRCEVTPYVKGKRANSSWWWLRSSGPGSNTATAVYYDGSVYSFTSRITTGNYLVRPAFWMNFTADEKTASMPISDPFGNYSKYYFSSDQTANIPKTPDLGSYDIGDIISIGQFEQDNDPSNGAEAVIWQVIGVENDRVLLLSQYALDVEMYFNNTGEEQTPLVTWETSSLRRWLNSYFYNKAFSAEEKDRILSVKLHNSANPNYRTDGGIDTTDYLFVLSFDEFNKYLNLFDESIKKCKPTAYAVGQGASVSNTNYAMCWLRNPGEYNSKAMVLGSFGSAYMTGYRVDASSITVRPAFWMKLK